MHFISITLRPECASEIFHGQKNFQLCAPPKSTIISFLWAGNSFSVLKLKKIQPQGGKNYPIVLSANEIAKCDRLKNKINTVKNCCEKSKCRVLINGHRMYSAMENWFQYKWYQTVVEQWYLLPPESVLMKKSLKKLSFRYS